MKKDEKLRKNNEFRTVYRRGKSFSNANLVLYIFKNGYNRKKEDNITFKYSRIGISVSKKVGKSVVRSRVKRLISESYRLNMKNIEPGYDFVVIARTTSSDKNYKDIETSLLNLFKRAGLYKIEKNID